MKILSILALTLALLNGNAYAAQIRQIADGQYSGEYNGVKLNNVQAAFNSITAKSNTGVELGAIIAVPSHAIGKYTKQNGWLPCDGVADTTGTELCKQNPGMCGKTPDLNNGKRFLQGTAGASDMVNAGLPNIKGNMLFWGWVNGKGLMGTGGAAGEEDDEPTPSFAEGSGATTSYRSTVSHIYTAGPSPTGGLVHRIMTFNAGNYSGIYQNEVDTVQPSAYTVHYFIRVNE